MIYTSEQKDAIRIFIIFYFFSKDIDAFFKYIIRKRTIYTKKRFNCKRHKMKEIIINYYKKLFLSYTIK